MLESGTQANILIQNLRIRAVQNVSFHIFVSAFSSRLAGSDVPDACFIRAPPGVADVLQCEVANALSCLMVSGSEELVSRVIRVKIKDGSHLHFPVNVVVPFCGSYRGSYRDVAVKIVDKEGRTSYLTPITTEGTYGGQWVKFSFIYSLFHCGRSVFLKGSGSRDDIALESFEPE